jgi:arsenate reductase
MAEITIYHNGECSKCRGALELLQERNIPHEVRWYLSEPLSKEEIKVLLRKLQIPASELVRRSEELYIEKFSDQNLTEDQWVDVLAENPFLIQRPIVEKDDKAIIARPPQKLFEVI